MHVPMESGVAETPLLRDLTHQRPAGPVARLEHRGSGPKPIATPRTEA